MSDALEAECEPHCVLIIKNKHVTNKNKLNHQAGLNKMNACMHAVTATSASKNVMFYFSSSSTNHKSSMFHLTSTSHIQQRQSEIITWQRGTSSDSR